MYKIKTFKSAFLTDLDDQVNEWLATNTNKDITIINIYSDTDLKPDKIVPTTYYKTILYKK